SGYPPYTISVPLSAGTHSFQLLFDNDAYGGSSATDRNAYLDYVTIATAAGTATPTSTPTTGSSTATSTPTPTSAATNSPTASPTAAATGMTLFGDGFGSGDFSAWSAVKTGAGGAATVQSSVVKSG